ncbi:MAG TPA: hypothetical protein VHV47_00430 [Opitutaceae bacterium]|jgi:hypothetical protein|nr:hypothetical protein [Opitutaceae bacterium]
MSLTLATVIPAILLLALGAALLAPGSGVAVALRAFPRSRPGAYFCFGAGAAWFLALVLNLSPVDFGDYKVPLFIAFAAIAILAFKCVPDFLAVRGLCVLVLLGASPLLDATYMHYEFLRRLWLVNGIIYVGITLALWLGAQPYRLRDFLEWLFARPGRARGLGGLLAAYGLLLGGVALSY